MTLPTAIVVRRMLVLTIFSMAVGCHNWDEFPWVTIPSPDGTHELTITVATGGIGGDSTFVRLYSRKRTGSGLQGATIYKIHSCQVFYAFWLDDKTIEIQLEPKTYSCAHHEGTITNVPGFSVVETTPDGTAKEAVARTLR